MWKFPTEILPNQLNQGIKSVAEKLQNHLYLLNDVLTALTESFVKHIICLNFTNLFWIIFVSRTNKIKIKI